VTSQDSIALTLIADGAGTHGEHPDCASCRVEVRIVYTLAVDRDRCECVLQLHQLHIASGAKVHYEGKDCVCWRGAFREYSRCAS